MISLFRGLSPCKTKTFPQGDIKNLSGTNKRARNSKRGSRNMPLLQCIPSSKIQKVFKIDIKSLGKTGCQKWGTGRQNLNEQLLCSVFARVAMFFFKAMYIQLAQCFPLLTQQKHATVGQELKSLEIAKVVLKKCITLLSYTGCFSKNNQNFPEKSMNCRERSLIPC